MDKYIGNKKKIVDGIEEFLVSKNIAEGIILDVFSGTTNVGQYFKQRGYSIISNDINEFSYILGKAYLENNEFPKFSKLIAELRKHGFVENTIEMEDSKRNIKRKITAEKIYSQGYYERIGYDQGTEPLIIVLQYLNQIDIDKLSKQEKLFFDYYTVNGSKSEYKSARGTSGFRNYFSETNSKRLGKMLETIKKWKNSELIEEMELCILLACILEEVTLNANVNGTFHDFNRSKLYPNAEIQLYLKPIILNIVRESFSCWIFREDANELYRNVEFKKIQNKIEVLYVDPPYNFRQYSAYYHMLNFIAMYHTIPDVLKYAEGFQFVRGQNMNNNFSSRYCYKQEFVIALGELVDRLKAKNVVISYYDENNHWNHGKEVISYEGREAILQILKENKEFKDVDDEPYIMHRQNYQSQSGAHKKKIEELIFYARR